MRALYLVALACSALLSLVILASFFREASILGQLWGYFLSVYNGLYMNPYNAIGQALIQENVMMHTFKLECSYMTFGVKHLY